MSYHQYRITVNKTQGEITEHYNSAQWERICELMEQRGGYAKLERRLVSDHDMKRLLGDEYLDGWIFLEEEGLSIGPWNIFAEADFVGS